MKFQTSKKQNAKQNPCGTCLDPSLIKSVSLRNSESLAQPGH